MSTMLHMPSFSSAPYGLQEKNVETFAPAFTSVNGRNSLSPASNDQKPTLAPLGTAWSPVSRPSASRYQPASNATSSSASSGESSPESPSKRRRSGSREDTARPSPDVSAALAGHQSGPSPPVTRDGPVTMENPQQRTLPPLDRPEVERRWATEPREVRQHHEPRPSDLFHNSGPSAPRPSLGQMDDLNSFEEGATELTRAGVQVELKKRKRQFANRTKTGCGTCRRRKKKCDETKPECSNCSRGGFICEGYANKIPWPKNGVTKPPPPLQAKGRSPEEMTSNYPRCPGCNQIHIPHCEPHHGVQPIYPEPNRSNGHDGVRGRPISVEDERKPPISSSWGNSGWGEHTPTQPPPPPRASYPPEPQSYAQPPPPIIANQERPPPNDHRSIPHQQSEPPRPQQHHSRVYHHTPQSMGPVVTSVAAPVITAKAATHHHQVTQQHPRQPPPPPLASSPMGPPSAAPSGPPPILFPLQSMTQKSEKEKMLAGQPFLPFDMHLANERTQCTGAVYQFNSTANPAVSIAKDERGRFFKTIVAARWIPPHTTELPVCGHLGGNVHVATPFNCDYGYNLSIGDNVVIGAHCKLSDSARICIGRNTQIGDNVTISTIKVPTDVKALKGSNGTQVAAEVHIDENVYIGDGCIIQAGVKIGRGAIVRPGSVVVRDLPHDCIAHGNPASFY